MTVPFLAGDPLPDTHWPYYTRRLERWWLLDADGWRPPVLHLGPPASVPAWRLTPATFAWFWKAVEGLDKLNMRDQARWAVGVLLDMDAWLTTHGLADQVRVARRDPAPRLPDPPPLLECCDAGPVDASFNARRGGR